MPTLYRPTPTSSMKLGEAPAVVVGVVVDVAVAVAVVAVAVVEVVGAVGAVEDAEDVEGNERLLVSIIVLYNLMG